MELGVPGMLGQQLRAALAFLTSGFDVALPLDDAVTGEQKPAGTMFKKRGRRWFLVADSLPGDLNVKAIAVTEAAILLETAPVSPSLLHRMAKDESLPLRWNNVDAFVLNGNAHACYLHRRQGKAFVDGNRVLVWRTLWTIPTKSRGGKTAQAAIALADMAFENNLFEEEAMISDRLAEAPTDSRRPQKPGEMRLNLNFHLQLSLEQVPVLCLETSMDQRMELSGIMALQRRALSMSDDEVAAWIQEDPSPEGQRRVLNVLVFAIAGKIKAGDPDVTWKAARAAARKLVFAPAGPT